MRPRFFSSWLRIMAIFAAIAFPSSKHAWAQNNNGNNNNFGGIQIDSQGVVSTIVPLKESAAAIKKRQQEFVSTNLAERLLVTTETRRLSLIQLDAQLSEFAKKGKEIPLEVRYLAGITRIDFIVVDRENRDMAIVGPAEGFAPDRQGRMRGIVSGRPVLQLEDLLVSWRVVEGGRTQVGCSIDPTEDGIAAFNAFTSQNQVATPKSVGQLFEAMAQKLGRQTISLQGVPHDSHFALTLVEADLRMKRIALGKDPSQVKGVTSQLSFLRAGGNTLSRWWFTPLYDPIQASADRSLFLLSGQRLQLLAQDEFTNAQGDRQNAPFTRKGTAKFAQQFTEHIPELVRVHPSFAELQNLFDWMVVCTLIRQSRLNDSIQWQPESLGNPELVPTKSYPVPTGVDSVATTNRVGRTVFGLVGGVELNASEVVSQTTEMKADSMPKFPTSDGTHLWND